VPGVEISCERDGASVHLLGYLLDPRHPGLAGELAHARQSRATRLTRIVERLTADGVPLTEAEVLARVPPGATPGRPHIADALVASGVVADRGQAFTRWLHDGSPYVVAHYAPDPVRAVELVLAAGGVPVLAHPMSTGRAASRLFGPLLAELAAVGLVGVEADHPDHDAAAVARVRELAAAYRLLVTGSSDYHGRGKRARLGDRSTDPAVWQAIRELGRGSQVVP
jgi:predicted metal-dependent phosphoesterase TrpH